MDINDIKKINKNVVMDDGTIVSFQKQLILYQSNLFDKTKPFVINTNSHSLDYVIPSSMINNPMIMNVSTVRKIDWKHPDAILLLADIEKHLDESVLAFDSLNFPESSKVVVLDIKNNDKEQMIAICRLDKSVDGNLLMVNEITSVYGKKNFINMLINTYEANNYFYKNKKTENFIQAFSTYLPKDLLNALSLKYDKQSFNKNQYEIDKTQEKEYKKMSKYKNINTKEQLEGLLRTFEMSAYGFERYDNLFGSFVTKFGDDISHNYEKVRVLGTVKGRRPSDDRYVIRFDDGTVIDNVYQSEVSGMFHDELTLNEEFADAGEKIQINNLVTLQSLLDFEGWSCEIDQEDILPRWRPYMTIYKIFDDDTMFRMKISQQGQTSENLSEANLKKITEEIIEKCKKYSWKNEKELSLKNAMQVDYGLYQLATEVLNNVEVKKELYEYNVEDVENMTEDMAKKHAFQIETIKEHQIYAIDFHNSLGVAAIAFKDGHNLLSKNIAKTNTNLDYDELRTIIHDAFERKLFTEKELTVDGVNDYFEYRRKWHYIVDYYPKMFPNDDSFLVTWVGDGRKLQDHIKDEFEKVKYRPDVFRGMVGEELWNHEAGYTLRIEDGLEACGVKYEELDYKHQLIVMEELIKLEKANDGEEWTDDEITVDAKKEMKFRYGTVVESTDELMEEPNIKKGMKM